MILLARDKHSKETRTELLLYLPRRSQVVRERLQPTRDRGIIILVDRYVDSTLAYQGYGRGLDIETIQRMNSFPSGDLLPNLTFLLDLDPQEGFRRKEKESPAGAVWDRLELEDLSFHERIRAGFLSIAGEEPDRIVVVASDREIDEVQGEIRQRFAGRFEHFLKSDR